MSGPYCPLGLRLQHSEYVPSELTCVSETIQRERERMQQPIDIQALETKDNWLEIWGFI